MDSGAMDHITGELDKLTVHDRYSGGDQVQCTNGTCMEIYSIGHSTLHSLNHDIHLNNILFVPKASKSLIFVNRLAKDNNVFLEFHPSHFLIKEQGTRRTLHKGTCEGGLYPFKPSKKQVLGVFKPSSSLWHHRLGHASSRAVQQIHSRHKLPFTHSKNNSVCDACQQGKSHQLPYLVLTSVSSSPLDLVFLDVWGPAPTSVGRHDYNVSVIDDYSKFTWIYLLHRKSEVFQCFHDFQNLVDGNLTVKSVQFRLIGDESINP
jgi:histone deacetylase 1/2